jgi:hypothetical protein
MKKTNNVNTLLANQVVTPGVSLQQSLRDSVI